MSKQVYQKITELMIDALKKDIVPWQRPWQVVNGGADQCNYTNKASPYRGINAMIKATMSMSEGYVSPYWVTRRQAEMLGGKVKGAGSPTFYWKFFDVLADSRDESSIDKLDDLDGDIDEVEEEATVSRRAFLRFSMAYNIEQVSGSAVLERVLADDRAKVAAANPDFGDIEACEEMVARHKVCEVTHGGNRAFYSPASDKIRMPEKSQYENPANYYHTLFHELAHATGHPSRLNRESSKVWGNSNYAFEELVAEMAACYLANECGTMSQIDFENSQSYVKSWIRVLEDNPKFIVMAATKAQHAAHWIKHGCRLEVKELIDNPEQSLQQRVSMETDLNPIRPRIPGVGDFRSMTPIMKLYHAENPPVDALLRALDQPKEADIISQICEAIFLGDTILQKELIEKAELCQMADLLRENKYALEADILSTIEIGRSMAPKNDFAKPVSPSPSLINKKSSSDPSNRRMIP